MKAMIPGSEFELRKAQAAATRAVIPVAATLAVILEAATRGVILEAIPAAAVGEGGTTRVVIIAPARRAPNCSPRTVMMGIMALRRAWR